MLRQEQIDDLTSTSFLNKVDDKLSIISEIRVPDAGSYKGNDELVLLYLNIFYEGQKLTNLSFNLINHEYEDIIRIAKNIGTNAFLLREVDEYLSGGGE